MVHVRRCPLGNRGKPTTEFFVEDKPMIYCYGWIDRQTDEPLEECQNCKDFVDGEQIEIDFAKMKG